MRPFALPLLFSLVAAPALAQTQFNPRPISLDGRILLAASDFPQTAPPPGYQGSYRPVAPQPQQAPCGGFSTPPCTGQTLPDTGATAEQLFLAAKQADANHQRQQSIDYLIRSAQMGYRKAQYALGTDYQNGNGVPKDLKKAAYWLNLAAQQGSTTAQQQLGNIDPAQATRYLQMGADQHDPQSEFDLGIDYELGRGVPHDRAKAMQYLRDASRYGGHTDGEQIAAALAKSSPSRRFQTERDLLALVPAAPVAPQYRTPAGCPAWYDSNHSGTAGSSYNWAMGFCTVHPNCPFSITGLGNLTCNGDKSPVTLR